MKWYLTDAETSCEQLFCENCVDDERLADDHTVDAFPEWGTQCDDPGCESIAIGDNVLMRTEVRDELVSAVRDILAQFHTDFDTMDFTPNVRRLEAVMEVLDR